MFCMNCGQLLPDGAKFCMSCGTPQGKTSPTGLGDSETMNLDGTHTFVPAMCPNCSARMKVDSSYKIARCEACGTECLVQDAIKALNVSGNVHVDSATINVSGMNTDSLLKRIELMLADGDFVGAMSKCDAILDSEPTNGNVYFYMLMSNLACRNRMDLANLQEPFESNQYYVKAVRYGDDSLKLELSGYLNIIKSRNEAEFTAKLKALKIGDQFCFGSYNGKNMYWRVLNIQGDRILMIYSGSVFINMPYHLSGGDVTWSDCELRKWLNNDFINNSFNSTERGRLAPSYLGNENNPSRKTPGGASTTDKVFLLSINEAKSLFANNYKRLANCWWWLRSPGFNLNYAAIVFTDGKIYENGRPVNEYGGVRPALWLNINS